MLQCMTNVIFIIHHRKISEARRGGADFDKGTAIYWTGFIEKAAF